MKQGYGRRLATFVLVYGGLCVVLLAVHAVLIVSIKQEFPWFGLGMLSLLCAIVAIVHVTKYGPTLHGMWVRPKSWLGRKLSKRRESSA